MKPRERFGDLSENGIYNQQEGQNLNSTILKICLITFPTGHNLYFKPGQTWSKDVVLSTLYYSICNSHLQTILLRERYPVSNAKRPRVDLQISKQCHYRCFTGLLTWEEKSPSQSSRFRTNGHNSPSPPLTCVLFPFLRALF